MVTGMRKIHFAAFALLTAVAALTGCGTSPSSEDAAGETATVEDYYATMRELPGLEQKSEAELAELATVGCDLIEKAIANGRTNSEAVDVVYRVFTDSGMNEGHALVATTALVGSNCPMDVTQ